MWSRRALLRSSARLTLLAPLAGVLHAGSSRDPRLILVILRGGLDGLAAVPPYGEARYPALRGELALGRPGTNGGALDLDGAFGLHPALANLHALYGARELVVLHAVATPYRERSHFDAQKVLEAGGTTPTTSAGGWLNRALTALAASGNPRGAVALAASVPLVLRGEFGVSSWAPSRLPETDDDTLARIRELYAAADPVLAARLRDALAARGLASDAGVEAQIGARRGPAVEPLATAAARFLAAPDGPRVAVIDIGGWDTHANQGAAQGALALRLRALDAGIATLRTELGAAAWADTSVLVVTEFGRTAAVNGTRGTDHGTAGCAFLAGGAVNGGRIIADWPGLNAPELHEGRDLRATLDLRAVVKGMLAHQFELSAAVLERDVFPDSPAARPLDDLIA